MLVGTSEMLMSFEPLRSGDTRWQRRRQNKRNGGVRSVSLQMASQRKRVRVRSRERAIGENLNQRALRNVSSACQPNATAGAKPCTQPPVLPAARKAQTGNRAYVP